jgi:hypothetical protein
MKHIAVFVNPSTAFRVGVFYGKLTAWYSPELVKRLRARKNCGGNFKKGSED